MKSYVFFIFYFLIIAWILIPFYSEVAYAGENNTHYSNLNYQFQWPPYDLTPPWRSAMANAESLNVLHQAYETTLDRKFLYSIDLLLNSFFIDVESGGVTVKSNNDGWWYELYAADKGKKSYVLNGMLVSLVELYEYYIKTKDNKSLFLFQKGLDSLKNNLSKFNYVYENGTYTKYDLCCGNLSPEYYHKLVLESLYKLYNLTGEDSFIYHYRNWSEYILPSILEEKERERKYPPVILDRGIPLIDYGDMNGTYIGIHRNPLTIAHYAKDYYENFKITGNNTSIQYFLNCANLLADEVMKNAKLIDKEEREIISSF